MDHKLEYGRRIENIRESKDFKELIESPLFRNKYETHRLEQKKNFLQYLSGFGVNFEKNGLIPKFFNNRKKLK